MTVDDVLRVLALAGLAFVWWLHWSNERLNARWEEEARLRRVEEYRRAERWRLAREEASKSYGRALDSGMCPGEARRRYLLNVKVDEA